MLMNKFLQLIDRNPDNFKHWACTLNCENITPVCRYVCYKLYNISTNIT